MGDRPLRWYGGDDAVPARRAGSSDELVARWRAHRVRFIEALEQLPADDWQAPTRCDDWNVREVVLHLITVDQFWAMTLVAAQQGEPTSMLVGFDPSGTPDEIIAPMRDDPPAAVLERFVGGSAFLDSVVDGYTEDQWGSLAESPMGHVSADLALAHGFWDSWLHERDVLLPLGAAEDPEAADILIATDYSLVAGALQGGLVGDPAPVGALASEALDQVLVIADAPGRALHVRVGSFGEGVSIDAVDADDALAGGAPAVEGLALVEGFTGRVALELVEGLPADLLAHFGRAQQVL